MASPFDSPCCQSPHVVVATTTYDDEIWNCWKVIANMGLYKLIRVATRNDPRNSREFLALGLYRRAHRWKVKHTTEQVSVLSIFLPSLSLSLSPISLISSLFLSYPLISLPSLPGACLPLGVGEPQVFRSRCGEAPTRVGGRGWAWMAQRG